SISRIISKSPLSRVRYPLLLRPSPSQTPRTYGSTGKGFWSNRRGAATLIRYRGRPPRVTLLAISSVVIVTVLYFLDAPFRGVYHSSTVHRWLSVAISSL